MNKSELKKSIYNSPVFFILLFAKLSIFDLKDLISQKLKTIGILIAICSIYVAANYIDLTLEITKEINQILLFSSFWIGLGILNSIGLGTGLPTFILYLAPKIIKLVLSSSECGSIAQMHPSRWSLFPSFKCAEQASQSNASYTFLSIFLTIEPEALLYGFGTAIGELPPYFISRAARLSGLINEELEEIKQSSETGWFSNLKKKIFDYVERNAFLTVFLMASIPNPLFDLAGLTCGHLLVPVWTFFIAAALGKSLIKVNLQVCFFIFVFSENQIVVLKNLIKKLFKNDISVLFETFIDGQRKSILGKMSSSEDGVSILGILWNMLILGMILFFLASIINSRVQGYLNKKQ